MFKVSLLTFLALINIVLCLNSHCADKTHTANSGDIEVFDYGRRTSCTKEIKLSQQNRWIKLTWQSFKVDGNMPKCKDYVAIYTGCSISNFVAKFCSNNLVSKPHDIYSKDGCMKIKLVTSGSTYKKNLGFKAHYSSGFGSIEYLSSSCYSKSSKRSSGIIKSPNWPEPYDYSKVGSFPDRECEWDIKRSSNELIQLNFMDVDLKNSLYSCYSEPYLEVEERKYCGTKDPFTTNTNNNKVDMKLKVSNYSSNTNMNRGFAVGWVTYKSNNGFSSVGVVIASVIILIVIMSAVWARYRKAKLKRIINYSSTAPTNDIVVNQTTNTLNQSGGAAYPSQSYMAHPSYEIGTKPYPGAPPSYSEVVGRCPPQGAGYPLQQQGHPQQSLPPAYSSPPQGAGYLLPQPLLAYLPLQPETGHSPHPPPATYPPAPQVAGYPQQPYGAGYPSQEQVVTQQDASTQ